MRLIRIENALKRVFLYPKAQRALVQAFDDAEMMLE